MSSYFDEKSARVIEASGRFTDGEGFIQAVAEIEQEMIPDIVMVCGDRQFPEDLREKAMSLIANWHVGVHAGLLPLNKAVEFTKCMRMSELVERMHSLFHEVASRRVRTRFGMLSDHPRDIIDRRDDYDAASPVTDTGRAEEDEPCDVNTPNAQKDTGSGMSGPNASREPIAKSDVQPADSGPSGSESEEERKAMIEADKEWARKQPHTAQ
jgi:hypothetical protein